MIARFLRLFAAFRILESEYARVCSENKAILKRVRTLHRERDVLSSVDADHRAQLDTAEARIVELTAMLDEARVSEIGTLRQLSDYEASVRTGRGIFNRPDSEVPDMRVSPPPIPKLHQQARDIKAQATRKYAADVKAFNEARAAKEAGEFFEKELAG